MSLSMAVLLDHIAEFLLFLPDTPLFWFTINTNYDHGCHLNGRFRFNMEDYNVLIIIAGLVSYAICLHNQAHGLGGTKMMRGGMTTSQS